MGGGRGERLCAAPPFPQITLSHVNVPFFLFDKVDEKVPRPHFVGLKRSLRPYAILLHENYICPLQTLPLQSLRPPDGPVVMISSIYLILCTNQTRTYTKHY